jgi:hypothetical protein
MAAEAVIIELFNGGRPIRYAIADASAVEKGTLMQISGDRTVSAHSDVDQPIAGILTHEKVLSDGQTFVSVYTDGIFDLTAAAAGVTALGARCAGSATANMITVADANDLLQSSDVGMCLEAHANNEVAAVRVNK